PGAGIGVAFSNPEKNVRQGGACDGSCVDCRARTGTSIPLSLRRPARRFPSRRPKKLDPARSRESVLALTVEHVTRQPRRSFMRIHSAWVMAVGLACAFEATSATLPAIKVLSNRADLISGGDALVEVTVPPGFDPNKGIKLFLNGTLVNQYFSFPPNAPYIA